MRRSHLSLTAFVSAVAILVALLAYQNCARPLPQRSSTNNGSLSSPTPGPTNSCLAPDGTRVANGMSKILFKTETASCGRICESVTAICSNGTFNVPVATYKAGFCQQLECPIWDKAESGNVYFTFPTDLTARKDDGAASSASSAYANGYAGSGKYYFEVKVTEVIKTTSGVNGGIRIGVASRDGRTANSSPPANFAHMYTNDGKLAIVNAGASSISSFSDATHPVAGFGLNDVIGVAVDLDMGWIQFFKNGVRQGTMISGLKKGTEYAPLFFATSENNAAVVANFGNTPFAFTPPADHQPFSAR